MTDQKPTIESVLPNYQRIREVSTRLRQAGAGQGVVMTHKGGNPFNDPFICLVSQHDGAYYAEVQMLAKNGRTLNRRMDPERLYRGASLSAAVNAAITNGYTELPQ